MTLYLSPNASRLRTALMPLRWIRRGYWDWPATLTCLRLALAPRGYDGAPGLRDMTAVCTDYDPQPRTWRDIPQCETDGHHLCIDCRHNWPAWAAGSKGAGQGAKGDG